MEKDKNKKAFTLTEIMITMMVLGFIILLSITNAKRLSPDKDKTKFIKAYNNIEKIVSQLVNDKNIYPGEIGLKDLSPVELLDADGNVTGEAFGMPDKKTKFRDAFKHNLHVVADDIECTLISGKSTTCFRTDEGIVYGIPDTDFESLNMETNKTKTIDASGAMVDRDLYLLPITIYTDFEKRKIAKTDAAFIGVSYTGQVKIIHSSADVCNEETTRNAVQCKAESFLKSSTLKKEN